jgi:hypothetical protein
MVKQIPTFVSKGILKLEATPDEVYCPGMRVMYGRRAQSSSKIWISADMLSLVLLDNGSRFTKVKFQRSIERVIVQDLLHIHTFLRSFSSNLQKAAVC